MMLYPTTGLPLCTGACCQWDCQHSWLKGRCISAPAQPAATSSHHCLTIRWFTACSGSAPMCQKSVQQCCQNSREHLSNFYPCLHQVKTTTENRKQLILTGHFSVYLTVLLIFAPTQTTEMCILALLKMGRSQLQGTRLLLVRPG